MKNLKNKILAVCVAAAVTLPFLYGCGGDFIKSAESVKPNKSAFTESIEGRVICEYKTLLKGPKQEVILYGISTEKGHKNEYKSACVLGWENDILDYDDEVYLELGDVKAVRRNTINKDGKKVEIITEYKEILEYKILE